MLGLQFSHTSAPIKTVIHRQGKSKDNVERAEAVKERRGGGEGEGRGGGQRGQPKQQKDTDRAM